MSVIGARRRGPSPRPRVVVPLESIPKKDDAPCCNAKRLPDGRLPIGYCGPDCIRRRK